MARTLDVSSIITLPVLGAEDAYALTSQLLTQSAVEGAPASVTDVLADLELARAALGDRLLERRAAPGVDTQAGRNADRAVDHAWGCLRDWLGAFVRLGAPAPRLAESTALYNDLFGQGLAFLNQRYQTQWTASESRLRTLAEPAQEGLVRELGGGPFLDHLRAAHEAYGRAVGVTAPTPLAIDGKVLPELDAVRARLREYAVAVLGTVRRGSPGSAELAEALLRPLTSWKSRKPGGGQGGEGGGEPVAG